MTGALWRSALVAALFALHPLHVESVAWVAERKDVLSTLFFMLTLLAYVGYVEQSEVRGPRSRLFYWLALTLFALGLMSKPMLVTLPFVLLLLDYWPLGRVSGLKSQVSSPGRRPLTVWALAREKLPFLALAIVSSAVTLIVQAQGGAIQPLASLPLPARFENAVISYAVYMQKMFWPADLAVPYLCLPPDVWPVWRSVVAGMAVAGISGLVVWGRRRPYLSVGWLWFLGTLVPVIGIVKVGDQSMADRYTYIPLIGLFMIVAWGGAELCGRLPRWKAPAAATGVAMLIGCAVLTRVQLGYWRNSERLFEHAVNVTEDNCIARGILGVALFEKGELDAAKAQFIEAKQIKLKYGNRSVGDMLYNLALVSLKQGKTNEARSYLNDALRITTHPPEVLFRLALLLMSQGRIEEAITHYRDALKLKPDMADVLNDLAWVLATTPDPKLRNGPEAVRLAERACELTDSKMPIVVGTLAAAYAEAGRFDKAISTGEKARSLALSTGQNAVAEKNAKLLELYHAGRPYREGSNSPPVYVLQPSFGSFLPRQ
jgi:Tfp pilus assembly protein PilF